MQPENLIEPTRPAPETEPETPPKAPWRAPVLTRIDLKRTMGFGGSGPDGAAQSDV